MPYAPDHPLPAWLTKAQRKTVEHFQAYNVPAEWFINPPDKDGKVSVIAVGGDADDGFIWSLAIEPDGSYAASEAALGPWETGITV